MAIGQRHTITNTIPGPETIHRVQRAVLARCCGGSKRATGNERANVGRLDFAPRMGDVSCAKLKMILNLNMDHSNRMTTSTPAQPSAETPQQQPTTLTRRMPPVLLLLALTGCVATATPNPDPHPSGSPPWPAHQTDEADQVSGVLVMAHGGGPEWNRQVEAHVSELRARIPVAIAFGMANPHTLQAALDSLEQRGVATVAVVRLFVSPESFLHQTEYLFGLRDDPPARAMMGHRMVRGDELPRLATDARILIDRSGLAGSEQVSRIVVDRARANASDLAETGAVLIAHGMGAEDENDRVLAWMEAAAAALRDAGMAEVSVAALREDWARPREEAEREIRATVEQMGQSWSRVVVIPYRLFGFGPYAKVLEGLEYVDTQGLLPHSLVSEWIAARVTDTLCSAGLASPIGPCESLRAENRFK